MKFRKISWMNGTSSRNIRAVDFTDPDWTPGGLF